MVLTGRYADGSGRPLSGQLVFTPNAELTDPTDEQVVPGAGITVTLDSGGAFSVPLYATDSGNLTPSGWAWNVTENVSGAPPRVYAIALPSTVPGMLKVSGGLESLSVPLRDDPDCTQRRANVPL